jgi:hypothetical protein
MIQTLEFKLKEGLGEFDAEFNDDDRFDDADEDRGDLDLEWD